MDRGFRNLRSENVISGLMLARWAPGMVASAFFLGVTLVLVPPAAAEDDEEESTPNYSESSQDAVERAPAAVERAEEPPVRKALARRKKAALSQFDPKVFEARGRELQGEYYEITSIAKAPDWSSAPANVGTTAPETSSRNWMVWSGVAGAAALVAGATGYLLLDQHTSIQPISVNLDDKP